MRGLMVLSIAVVLFFAVAFALTVSTDGKLGNLLALGGKIGVVEVKGVINDSEDAVEALKTFEKSPAVKAIVVRIESPGGGVAPIGNTIGNTDRPKAAPCDEQPRATREQLFDGGKARQVAHFVLWTLARPPVDA